MTTTWKRLEQLRAGFDTEIHSFMDGDGLCWSVTIHDREQQGTKPIVAIRADLSDAVHEAVAQAEQLGWLPPDL